MSKDAHLQLEVIAELNWEPSVRAAHIGVAASAGVITLTGEVESYSEKHAAETAARRVKGVVGVAQEIKVQLPFERERGDDQRYGRPPLSASGSRAECSPVARSCRCLQSGLDQAASQRR